MRALLLLCGLSLVGIGCNVKIREADLDVDLSRLSGTGGPTIELLLPDSGPDTGGTVVSIRGAGFAADAQVSFGGATCTVLSVSSETEILCTTPPHSPGAVAVTVVNADGGLITFEAAFTFRGPPLVSSISPSAGRLAGGNTVTILGSGFQAGATVTIGGTACASPSIASTSISCAAPAKPAGGYDVVVTNIDSRAGTLVAGYVYNPFPVVTSVAPSVGPPSGGTSIALTGSGFLPGATVTVGGAACGGVNVASATTIVCTVAAGSPGAADIVVSNIDTQSATLTGGYTYGSAPGVASVSPTNGKLAGGGTLTVTGSNFVAGATAKIGTNTCSSPNVASATSLTCTIPAGTAGTYGLTVTNPDTQTGTLASAYTYNPFPVVSSVSPVNGRLVGGGTLTVTGTGFLAGAAVTIGSNACTSPNVTSATSLTCTIPAGSAGSYAVTVTNADTQSGSLGSAYAYNPLPTLSGVSPASGPTAGGTHLTLTGTGFLAGASALVGGVACANVVVASAISITCDTPSGPAGTFSVAVTNADSQSISLASAFTYVGPPAVSSVGPTNGKLAGGGTLTITGSAFVSGATAKIGSTPCTSPNVASATSMTCTIPAGSAGTYAVTVTNPDTQTGSLASAYTYNPFPTFSSISPASGPTAGATHVTLTGTGFLAGAGVTVGGAACANLIVASATSITCDTPTGSAGAANVVVTNTDTQSVTGTGAFTFIAPPAVSSVSPTNGKLAGGGTLTITGSAFVSGATAKIGSTTCTGPNVASATSMTCTIPAGSAGTYAITVTNPDTQTGSLASAYTYNPFPTFSSISPASGPTAGGTHVTVTGTGFLTGAGVTVGGSACANLVVASATSITCDTPAGSTGAANVVVTHADTQSVTGTGAFTFVPAPAVSAVSPTNGKLAGGGTLTITGSAFVSGATAKIGSTTCTSPNVASATSMTCTIPAGSAGTYAVTVTNPDTQVGSLASAYTYNPFPTFTSIAATSGSTVGGTHVTVTGTGFLSGAAITVGGAACANLVVASATSITCDTPSGSAGAANVVVTNADTQAVTGTGAFTFIAPPAVSSISPTNGKLAGGGTLTITGSAFVSGATAKIGSTTCTSPNVASATSMTCTIPAGSAGIFAVTVTNPDTQTGSLASAYTYNPFPTFSSVAATSGPTAGGTHVTVTGTGFLSGAGVTVGGSACANLIVASATSITCDTPTGSAGAANVVVTNADTQSVTGTGAFTFIAPPAVSSVSPTNGKLAGGGTLTIAGSAFVSGATAKIGSTTCTSPNVASATSMTCTIPAGSAGTFAVTVTNPDTQVGSLASAYTYNPFPTFTSIAATSGPTAGGTHVTVTGTGFLAGAAVAVGGSACSTLIVASATSITCDTPSGSAGAANVVVTNADTQSATGTGAFTFIAPPAVSSVSPTNGKLAGGGTLTLTGSAFVSGATVTIGSTTCTSPNVASATSMTCTIPAGSAGTYAVTVTNPDTQTGSLASAYSYNPFPTFTSIAATSGPTAGGTHVTVTGTGFLAGAAVAMGGSACTTLVVASATSITCDTPAGSAGAANVVVTNADTQSVTGTGAFTYVESPVVSSVSPTNGKLAGGGTLTITGFSFVNGATVTIGSTTCTSPNVASATSMTCTIPAASAGAYAVTVTNPDTQTGSLSNAYTYNPVPTYSSVSPTIGSTAGNTHITVTGTGFLSGASVTVGGSSCANLNVASATALTCDTPAGSAGAANLVVTNADTQSVTGTGAFTFSAPPAVSSVSPTNGKLAGGGTLTITGSAFVSGATAKIGSTTCTSPNVASATSMTCTIPAGSAGTYAVTVTNPDTITGSLASAYTYNPVPTFSSISPGNGTTAGGTHVTLTGTGFLAGAGVTIGGAACTSVSVASATSITCDTPSGSTGAVNVVITSADTQSVTGTGAFTYLAPAPTLSSISPTNGTVAGGTTVTLTGTGFIAGATVTIGGTACLTINVASATSITCKTPTSSVAASVNVVVTNTDAQSATLSNGYTYTGTPALVPDSAQSTLTASPPLAPSDGVAQATITVVPRTSGGVAVGASASVEVTVTGSGVTLTGSGACRTPSAQCTVAVDLGNGTYTVTAVSSTTGSYTFTAAVARYPDISVTQSGAVNFDSSQFTTINVTTTITNGTHGGLNLYLTGGTATFDSTTEGHAFGHLFVKGATVVHSATSTGAVRKLDVTVSSLTLQSGSINANNLGYTSGYSYGSSTPATTLASTGQCGASHGGYGNNKGTPSCVGPTYDNYRSPALPGAGRGAAGGGVVRIASSGLCTVASGATITANASGGGYSGAGGSIYLSCAGFAGNATTNALTANGDTGTGGDVSGGGGRVALISTGDVKTFAGTFTFPTDATTLTALKLRVRAYGGGTNTAGAGSVYLKHTGLTYGALIIDNGGNTLLTTSGTTMLVSVAGTVNGAPGATTLPITPSLSAGYDNLYAGTRVRPDVSYTNGTTSDWTDDNVLTVASNTTSVLTASSSFSGVSNGATFRSIDILDHLDISGGAFVESKGDIYVVNGPVSSPGGVLAWTNALLKFTGSAGLSPAISNQTFTSGTYTLDSYAAPGSFTLAGATMILSTLTVGGNFSMSSGTLYHPISTTTVTNTLNLTVSGTFTMSGGSITLNGQGYPSGYSFGSAGPSTTLAPTGSCGSSHGGRGSHGASASTCVGPTYDSVKNPVLPGGGRGGAGGGALIANVTGICTINSGATINANNGSSGYSGAGGTVNLRCGGFAGTAGTNAITANGDSGTGADLSGGGGRIALVSSGGSGTFTGSFAYPTDAASLTALKLRVRAYGGGNNVAAAGTIYLKHSGLTYGALIVDNGGQTMPARATSTFLPSIAGTVNGAPGATTLPITPSLAAGYTNLYAGMQLRPDLSFTNGTASDWSDDNILTLASNTTTALTMTAGFSGIAGGETFRSIDIFDNLDVAGGAQLESNGDIYVTNGTVSSPGSTSFPLTNSMLTFNGSAAINLPTPSLTLSSGTFSVGTYSWATDLTISGATVSATALTVGGNTVLSSGSLTTQALTVAGNTTISGGTLTHSATTTSTVNKLTLALSGTFTMSGGTINLNGLGYTTGYSFGSAGPATTLATTGQCGASHGGRGAYGANPSSCVGPTYDNYRDPQLPGAGRGQTGGGALVANVTGTCTINSGATITANFGSSSYSGAGGTINLKCGGFAGTAGTNALTANGDTGTGSDMSGGGGRIALISSGNASSFAGSFAYPVDSTTLTNFKLRVRAYGGAGGNPGAAGTIYLKHSGLTYGALIIDNGGVGTSGRLASTFLPSLSGTVNGAPGATTLPITPSLAAGYTNLYAGMQLRPDVSYDAGTSANWSDDNILTVASNSTTVLTTTASFSGIAGGETFRSIDILDNVEVTGGGMLESNGDVYVLNGLVSSPGGGTSIALTNAIFQLNGSAAVNFTFPSSTFSSGTWTLGTLSWPNDLTISGATINGTSLSVGGNATFSSGSVTSPAIAVTGNATVSGSTLTSQSITVNGSLTTSGGTITHAATTTSTVNKLALSAASLTMNGGTINLNGLGYTVGYSFGSAGPATTVASTGQCGSSHGGKGAYGASASTCVGPTYDNYRDPQLPGAGRGTAGGGVLLANVTGTCTINSGATIVANNGGASYSGAGGTINLKCGGFAGTAGTNALTANGDTGTGSDMSGGGGRIALISSGNASTFAGNFAYPVDASTLTAFKLRVRAYGGAGGNPGAAGTVYLKHSGLTYGALVVDNGGSGASGRFTSTLLPSLSGTVNGAPGATTLPLTPSLAAGYTNLYAGMQLRPNVSYDAGTATDWSDDNVLTVASNTTTVLTATASFSGIAGGETFRSIDILDNIDIAGGGMLESNGDIFVVNGPVSSPGGATLTLTNALVQFNGSAATNLTLASPTLSSGTWSLGTFTWANNLTISGATVIGTSLSVGGNATVSSGSLTSPTLAVTGNATISGGTVTTQSFTVGGGLTTSGGTLAHIATTTTTVNKLALSAGSLTMNGGAINLNGLGYISGWSYGSAGPSTVLASTAQCGASHGGHGNNKGTPSCVGRTYDNYRDPQLPGAGRGGPGGGVLLANVTGTCTINSGATITANFGSSSYSGAGGTINLRCGGFAGTAAANAITANGDTGTGSDASGGGGRIALISSGNAASFAGNFAYPVDASTLSTFKQRVRAYGGAGGNQASAGTIYLKSSDLVYGDLLIDNGKASLGANDGSTDLISATDNSNGLDSQIDANTSKVTAAGTPYANLLNLFANHDIHVYNTSTGNADPQDGSHTVVTLSGNGSNTFLTTGNALSSVGTGNTSYRFTYHLDHLHIAGYSRVTMTGADLWLQSCDIASSGSGAFAVPTGSTLTGNSLASSACYQGSLSGSITFTNTYLPP